MQQSGTDYRPLIRALVAIALLVAVGVAGDVAGWWDVPDFVFGT